MATVYRAHRPERPEHPVALKVLRPGEPELAARLRREWKVQRDLSHPNVLGVHDLLELPDGPALVLEYVAGPSLAEVLTSDPLPLGVVDDLVRGILEGVGAAHGAGIVHRDLKPGNVLLARAGDTWVPRVCDFGLARADVAVDSLQTASGLVAGTPRYMAPEQLRDARCTSARSDVFALGAVLYEILTGRPCFGSTDPVQRIAHITSGHFEPLDTWRDDVPERWRDAVRAALSVDPADRPADAGALLAAWGAPPLAATPWPASLRVRVRRAWRPESLVSLPRYDDAFVGRGEVHQTLAEALEDGPLTTVVGVGGVGKTRLSVEVGHTVAGGLPGGAWFCDLTDARSVEGITHAIAQVLGVPLDDDPVARVGAILRGRGRLLVVLDNFEQVVEHAASTVGAWLRMAPEARFLVTSREPLRLPEERVVRLDALDVDEDADALALFTARARQVLPDFELGPHNRDAAHGIVGSLGGLPLAIEIVAARVREPSLARLRDKLAGRLQGLSRRGSSDSTHRRTLAATFDWSWDLLSAPERAGLAQLGVFEGGCTLEAACEVLQLDADVATVLEALVVRSLVRRRGERFSLLPPVAEYARARLRAGVAGVDVARLEARHVATYARLGSPEELEVLRVDSRQFVRRAADLDNLLVAARGEGTAAASAALAVCALLARTGPRSTAVAVAQRALEAPELESGLRTRLQLALAEAAYASGDLPSALEGAASIVDGDEAELAVVRARAALLQGRIRFAQGEPAACAEACERSIHGARAAGAPHVVGAGLVLLAKVAGHRADADEAMELLLRVQAEGLTASDPRLEADVWAEVGSLHVIATRFDEGEVAYDRALAAFRSAADLAGEAVTRSCLGTLDRDRGRLTSAMAHYEEALRLSRRVGDRRSEAQVISSLGNLQWRAGRMERAQALLEEAVRMHRELGDRPWEGFVLSSLANVLMERGRLHAALQMHREALEVFEQVGQRYYVAMAHGNLAHMLRMLGDLDAAPPHMQAALATFEDLGNPVGLGATYNVLGCWHVRMGHPDEAWALLQRGLALHRDAGDLSHLASNLQVTAAEALALGRLEDAEGHAREALAMLLEMGGDDERADARATLAVARLRLGDATEARTCLELAGLGLEQLRSPTSRVSVGCALAELAAHDGDHELARHHERQVSDLVDDLELLPGSELSQRLADLRERLARAA